MTPQQVVRIFDIILDKVDSPYYLPQEKYDFLSLAQRRVLDKYFYNKSGVPNDPSAPIGSYENTEYNAAALNTLLNTVRMRTDISGHISFGAIDAQLNFLSNLPDAQVYQVANTATVTSTPLTGTLTIAQNGTITGTGTQFNTQLAPGAIIFTQDKNWTVSTVTNNTTAQVLVNNIVQESAVPMRVIANTAERTTVQFVRQNDILAFQKNVFKKPTTAQPLRCIDGIGYLFYPLPTSDATRFTVEMNVLRMPQDFNAMNNIGFELAPFTHDEIVMEALSIAGVSIRETEFQQVVQQLKNE